MDKLPRPLIALVNSIFEEYEQFAWNSHSSGDKMRISLVWTRGEEIAIKKGIKHKSKSCKKRDSKRLKVWQDNIAAQPSVDDNVIIDNDNENSESVYSESDIELESDTDLNTPQEAPVQVDVLPVVNKPVDNILIDNYSDNFRQTGVESRTSDINKTQVTNVNITDSEEIKTVAPKSIITGRSPCTDSHYEKVVFSRTSQGDLIIGKVKKRDIIVSRNMTKREKLRHVEKVEDEIDYEEFMSYMRRFKDIRRSTNAECTERLSEIPLLDRYAEKYRMCPYCFKM